MSEIKKGIGQLPPIRPTGPTSPSSKPAGAPATPLSPRSSTERAALTGGGPTALQRQSSSPAPAGQQRPRVSIAQLAPRRTGPKEPHLLGTERQDAQSEPIQGTEELSRPQPSRAKAIRTKVAGAAQEVALQFSPAALDKMLQLVVDKYPKENAAAAVAKATAGLKALMPLVRGAMQAFP